MTHVTELILGDKKKKKDNSIRNNLNTLSDKLLLDITFK